MKWASEVCEFTWFWRWPRYPFIAQGCTYGLWMELVNVFVLYRYSNVVSWVMYPRDGRRRPSRASRIYSRPCGTSSRAPGTCSAVFFSFSEVFPSCPRSFHPGSSSSLPSSSSVWSCRVVSRTGHVESFRSPFSTSKHNLWIRCTTSFYLVTRGIFVLGHLRSSRRRAG